MTLNQIKHKLIGFFESHAQINEVRYKDDFDFNVETDLSFPVVNIQYLDSTITNKLTNHRYRIYLVDLMDDNVAAIEDEIVSDMMSVAEDFTAWLPYQEGIVFNKQARITPVANYTVNRLSGIELSFTISTVRTQNECAKPTNV